MTSDDISSQEKLDRLYAEEKISKEDYDLLRRSLEGKPDRHTLCNTSEQGKKCSWAHWVIIGLTVMSIHPVLFSIGEAVRELRIHLSDAYGMAITPVVLAITAILIFGLSRRYRWAFIAAILFCYLPFLPLIIQRLQNRDPIGMSTGMAYLSFQIGTLVLVLSIPHCFRKTKIVRPE